MERTCERSLSIINLKGLHTSRMRPPVSIFISTVFLLAVETKIKDQTVVSQIND